MQRVGLVQMTSGPEISRNLTYLKQEVAKLAQQGAQWIVTPENALLLGIVNNTINKPNHWITAQFSTP